MSSNTDQPTPNTRILLHSCCAPCSSAIIEWMLQNDIRPTIFYCNPNIYPKEEYLIRKNEITRYARQLGLDIIDDDQMGKDEDGSTIDNTEAWNAYHQCWLESIKGMEDEPERGKRCLQCFKIRLLRAAKKTAELGFDSFTTTLASSRWKSLDQINEAGTWAAEQVNTGLISNTQHPSPVTHVTFIDRNWRRGGLQQRRNELLRENGFYNQLYCGCEFSLEAMKRKSPPPPEGGVLKA